MSTSTDPSPSPSPLPGKLPLPSHLITTNRSCAWVAQKTVEIQNRPVPAQLGAADVLVQVVATGICGSDCHNWESAGIQAPLVLGHESAGVIVEVGTGVVEREVGQRVAIEPGFACMRCQFCKTGNPNICANLEYCGLEPTDGTLCQYFRCGAHMTVQLPKTVSWQEAGCVQPLAIAVQLGRRANLRAHQTVAIFGCGPLGLLVMAVAKAYGAAKVIVFDIEPSRVEFATKYCADVGVVCPQKSEGQDPMAFATDFVQKTLKEHGLSGGVDLAVEASGADACMQMAVVAAKPGATCIQAGLGKSLSAVPMFLVTAKELTIKGTVRYTPGCFADAIDLLERRLVDLGPLITSTYPLTRAAEAFQAQHARKDIKIVIMNQE